jgi:hypothetical protein
MQNPENNAMTEVALALAMAFFAIFIVAAVSLNPAVSRAAPAAAMQLVADAKPGSRDAASIAQEPQWLIHTPKGWVDAQLNPVDIRQLDRQRPVRLAVAPHLPAEQLLQLQQQIAHPDLAITLMSTEWQRYLGYQQ